jgi:hypothetical protein
MMFLMLLIPAVEIKYVYLVYCMGLDYFDGFENRFALVLLLFS